MSIESQLKTHLDEHAKVSSKLASFLHDVEKRVSQLPNEIAALEKRKAILEQEYQEKMEKAKSDVASVYKKADELDAFINGKMSKFQADKQELEKVSQLQTALKISLEAQRVELMRKEQALTEAQTALEEKLKKVDSIKASL